MESTREIGNSGRYSMQPKSRAWPIDQLMLKVIAQLKTFKITINSKVLVC